MAFQRKHLLVDSGIVDRDTREALLTASEELDFRAALRVLGERVADATGLVEDGSALDARETVLGRQPLPGFLCHPEQIVPASAGAPDLLARATEAAAIELGWLAPASARAFFAQHDTSWLKVALTLPPPPAYHSTQMPLSVVIDRGDAARGGRRSPSLTVFAHVDGRELALVRWPTTIGGWQKEKLASGRVVRRHKPSPLGAFLWQEIVAAPAWFAPETTPDEELVRRERGRWVPREDSIGPGYRSAYGLVMIVHHQVAAGTAPGATALVDTGIRTHGTVNYRSVLVDCGASHGCHRLFSPLAQRLASFLLRHRPHSELGEVRELYRRVIRWAGQRWTIERDSRGFRYALESPIPVTLVATAATTTATSERRDIPATRPPSR
jgi:hypothetical protein